MKRFRNEAVFVSVFVLIGCVFVPLAGLGDFTAGRGGVAGLLDLHQSSPGSILSIPRFSTTPIRCTGSPTLRSPRWEPDPYHRGDDLSGPVTVNLPLVAGQGLQITNGGTSYYIRCLAQRRSRLHGLGDRPHLSRQNGYLLTLAPYVVVFDTDGVPVWWYRYVDPLSPIDAKFRPNSTMLPERVALTSTSFMGWTGLNADGLAARPIRSTSTISNCCPTAITWDPGRDTKLPRRSHPVRGPLVVGSVILIEATILDDVIVEVTPANQVVWRWSVADHINVAAANVNWHDQFPDVIHMNSILYDGNGGIIFSARHLDAVYRIDMATGALTWKLGGSPEPESLNVTGDQYLGCRGQLFSGQHYARIAPDGSLTVHDNGTRPTPSSPCRAIQIDTIDQYRHRGGAGHRLPAPLRLVVGARRSWPAGTGSCPGATTTR